MRGDVRGLLRGLPVFDVELPAFDPAAAPPDPVELFVSWLAEAIAAGVPEPHAVTVSTVDADGVPDARVLILKDVDASGFSVATTTTGAAGAQLAARPAAALSSYWPLVGRQVRVRGRVVLAAAEVTAADFLARSVDARVRVLAGSSDPSALASARERVLADPSLVAPTWQVYRVEPTTIEFWQAAVSRDHVRLRYRRNGSGWDRW